MSVEERNLESPREALEKEVKSLRQINRRLANFNQDLVLANAELRKAAQEFVEKCDRGEARSKRSYAAFKAALAINPEKIFNERMAKDEALRGDA